MRRFLASVACRKAFKEKDMDWIFMVAGGLLWLAVYGLARGCARLQARGQGGRS